jgi:hypothetical protein
VRVLGFLIQALGFILALPGLTLMDVGDQIQDLAARRKMKAAARAPTRGEGR